MTTLTSNQLLRKTLLICGFGMIMSLGNGYAQDTEIDEPEPESEPYMIVNTGLSMGTFIYQPALNVSLDQVFAKGFSLGLGVNYTNFGSTYGGFLSRTNIGLRALYQFDKNPYFQMYTGLRAGASIWSGSGSKPGPWAGFFGNSFSGGDVIPTIQGLFGVRYMPTTFLGIHTELALGAPYFISAGVSINLQNVESGVKDIYNAVILEPERKNIVKLNISTAVGAPGISYERYLLNRFTVEVGGSASFYSSLIPRVSSYVEAKGLVSESDSLHQKINAYGMIKMYTNSTRRVIPRGFYVGAGYNYINQKILMKVEDLRPVPDGISYTYEKESEMHSGMLVLGYQQPFAKRFTVDAFLGGRFGTSDFKSVKYLDANANEEKFQTSFGGHREPLKTNFKPVFFRVSMGFMF